MFSVLSFRPNALALLTGAKPECTHAVSFRVFQRQGGSNVTISALHIIILIYRYMLGTQFEPMDARKAFPCLDEPALKAKFNISMWRKEGIVALTNMPNYTSVARYC